MWLQERLKLPISEEKSKITNLSKEESEFLGFTMKLVTKGNKKVVNTHIGTKAQSMIKVKLKNKSNEFKKVLIAKIPLSILESITVWLLGFIITSKLRLIVV